MSAGESLIAMPPKSATALRARICQWVTLVFGRCPLTIMISIIAILTYVLPGMTDGLQLDFACVVDGQWWRLLSGHLTHFDNQHLFWDLLMFVVLGAACERQHPRLYGIALLAMTLGISAVVIFLCKDVTEYRGLSGVDTGLFVWFIGDQIRQSFADRDRLFTGIWLTAGSLLLGKLLFEFVTGELLFVDASGFKPLLESHLVGAAVGLLLAGLGWVGGGQARRLMHVT